MSVLMTSGSASTSPIFWRGLSDHRGSGTPSAPCGALLVNAVLGDVDLVALDEQLAGGRRVDQRQDAGERRLARAGLADDRQRLALFDLEARRP